MFDEDRAEERILSMPRHLRDRWHEEGMSAPPEGLKYATEPPNLPEPPPSPYAAFVACYDALRHLYAVASAHPDLARWCEGTLDQARDALAYSKRTRED